MNTETRQANTPEIDAQISALLAEMTLAEKIGQMSQINIGGPGIPDHVAHRLRAGTIGSVLNIVDVELINELQRISMDESRLGIPLLIGRDVIHGFKTVMPIPLGQAATWNPEVVRAGAAVAAREAARSGVNWTFAPMVDISRDPRWGRIAESFGEDPLLTSVLGVASVEGYQGDDLAAAGSIAACAKHFVGYGASESGCDYSATNIPENELRNVYLPPFRAAVDAGAMTLMTSFSDIDGVPATANGFLVNAVLRGEWGFEGFVVSDWDSVGQLAVHGLTADDRESAFEAANAGVDMEMFSETYLNHLPSLIDSGEVDIKVIDRAVANILRTKFRLGLFVNPYTDPGKFPAMANEEALQTAKLAALHSVVLLKNDHQVLPLSRQAINSLAVIGPLADAPYEQLGTWIFDGDPGLSVTPLAALHELVGADVAINHLPTMPTSRSRDTGPFDEAVDVAAQSDAVLLFLGEESILSGEAHSRADINLPGAQAELVKRIRATGKPVVAIIMAGRPLTLTNIVDEVDAILFAWHPGTMGGPAIVDLLFGVASPSGKLPVTFPRMVGQVPIYYNHKHTGRPPTPDTVVHIDDIEANAPQVSLGMTAFHLDAGYTPLYAFGHGLSYTRFEYHNIQVSRAEIALGDAIIISADLTNVGDVAADVPAARLVAADLVLQLVRYDRGEVRHELCFRLGFDAVELIEGGDEGLLHDVAGAE